MTIPRVGRDDHGEAKEALAAALVQRLYRELSGEGEQGAYVCGEKPSRRFATAFLMPMRDRFGMDSLAEYLKIPTIGMDLQILRGVPSKIGVGASYAVYVLVLPEWDDIVDSRNAMRPRFMLNDGVKQALDGQVRERFALVLEQHRRDAGRAANAMLRKQLRDEVFHKVCAELGIPDLVNDADEERDEDETEPGEEAREDGRGGYRFEGSNIPPGLVRPAAIPMKWKRFATGESLAVAIPTDGNNDDCARLAEELSELLRSSIVRQVAAWLETPEGQAKAYRDVRVMPADVAGPEAWRNFLERARAVPAVIDRLLPPGLPDYRLAISKQTDFGLRNVDNMRVVLENTANDLGPRVLKRYEQCIFQVEVKVTLPAGLHHRLRLQRIKPSYRFRDFFSYAALGINCGIKESRGDGTVVLSTTCLPKYQQPKLEGRKVDGLDTSFAKLGDEGKDLACLYGITQEYSAWVDHQRGIDPAAHLEDESHRQAERVAYEADIAAYGSEIDAIRQGIRLLEESRRGYLVNSAAPEGVPYRAWLLLNRAMARAWGINGAWRLFQLTFILSHLPGQASRCHGFQGYYDHSRDDETATLLYFPTGGGKSEAFYGLLVYSLFLDRLRGKTIGITALIRYPLRLLTIQQAQRLFRLLAQAEMIRLDERVPGDPFAIGFWVGSSNTPNKNAAKELSGVILGLGAPDPAEGDNEYQEYRVANRAFNKVPECPYCKGVTGLRRGGDPQKRVAIVCTDLACPWNVRHGGQHPLPFHITDEDIYGFAPAVVLGTIDKLALIGQHDSTINMITGMLGLARFRGSGGRLLMPRTVKQLTEAFASATPVAPAFNDGEEIFFDPFPSLVIQDEAHLLEESLGTFAALFETAFDQLLTGLAPLLGDRVARDGNGAPRLPKVIAATATISSPDRQIETLYQRRATRFPYPGTSLYESFYTIPTPPFSTERGKLLPADDPRRPEAVSPVMRTYATLITNGRVYAVATATALATYHAIVTRWWRLAARGDAGLAREVCEALPPSPLRPFWEKALNVLTMDELHSILDLFRITLVYVNSKRGGDQVLDSITDAAAKRHLLMGEEFSQLQTALISGGVDITEIQKVMRRAEEPVNGADLDGALREIVATSAISHGVDLDMFNAMYFVGAPSEIAEYIQASSRVGRTHTGFSLLLPTPHSRRDRYIVEVHDIFHRFLEQMVAPAAVERWADNAIRRVMPSIFQLWLNGVKEQEQFMGCRDKLEYKPLSSMATVKSLQSRMGNLFISELTEFALRAVAVQGRGEEGLGRPGNMKYYEDLLHQLLRDITNELATRPALGDSLADYWRSTQVQMRPMTSLRDIDEAGYIVPSQYLPGAGFRTPQVLDAIVKATKLVREQTSDSSDMDSEEGPRP